jgi:hypothetical protein
MRAGSACGDRVCWCQDASLERGNPTAAACLVDLVAAAEGHVLYPGGFDGSRVIALGAFQKGLGVLPKGAPGLTFLLGEFH